MNQNYAIKRSVLRTSCIAALFGGALITLPSCSTSPKDLQAATQPPVATREIASVGVAAIGPCVTNTKQPSKWIREVTFSATSKRVQGWVYDERNPCRQLIGTVWIGTVKLGDLRATQPSNKLSTAVDTAINSGFTIQVPDSKILNQNQVLQFKRDGVVLFQTTLLM